MCPIPLGVHLQGRRMHRSSHKRLLFAIDGLLIFTAVVPDNQEGGPTCETSADPGKDGLHDHPPKETGSEVVLLGHELLVGRFSFDDDGTLVEYETREIEYAHPNISNVRRVLARRDRANQ